MPLLPPPSALQLKRQLKERLVVVFDKLPGAPELAGASGLQALALLQVWGDEQLERLYWQYFFLILIFFSEIVIACQLLTRHTL